MSFEALNLTWFEKINASQNASNAMIDLAIFIANDVLYLLILFLLFLWFYGDQQLKERALRAVFFTALHSVLVLLFQRSTTIQDPL